VFSVKRNRNGFAAFGKILAVPCPFVMTGKEQRARFQPRSGSALYSIVWIAFQIILSILVDRETPMEMVTLISVSFVTLSGR
jgi:hypothetical protein